MGGWRRSGRVVHELEDGRVGALQGRVCVNGINNLYHTLCTGHESTCNPLLLARANDLLTSPSLNPALGAWSWPGPWRSAADPTREQGGEQPPNPRRPYLAPWTLAASDVMRSRDQCDVKGYMHVRGTTIGTARAASQKWPNRPNIKTVENKRRR